MSLSWNKPSVELIKAPNHLPQILSFQFVFHYTSSYSIYRWLNFHRPWEETHQVHLTNLVVFFNFGPFYLQFLYSPTSLCALTQPACDKSSHIQVVWRHTYGSIVCSTVFQKSIIKPPWPIHFIWIHDFCQYLLDLWIWHLTLPASLWMVRCSHIIVNPYFFNSPLNKLLQK